MSNNQDHYDDNDDDDDGEDDDEEEKLKFLKLESYYKVRHAFKAESTEISGERIILLNDLRKLFGISVTTHNIMQTRLEQEPLVQHLMGKEEEKQTNESSPEDLPVSHISPESLTGKRVSIKLLGEDKYIQYDIKDYDAGKEMHQLVSTVGEDDSPGTWLDLQECAEDIIWEAESPVVPVDKPVVEKRKALWRATSTTLVPKQLQEYGKTERGIPIIAKQKATALEKGKGIATEQATPSPVRIPASGASWDIGAAEFLIGIHIRLRLPGEDEMEDFVITKYNAKDEMHSVQNTYPNAMETDELMNEFDFREIPPQDIEWKS